MAKPPLTFELEGTVHADEAVAVPLFGPPGQVRIEHVMQDGHAAAVSFDEKQYFFITAARHFVLRGELTMLGDPTLTIPGPLNALDTELTGGRVVEGGRLSGLSATVIHFEQTGAVPAWDRPRPSPRGSNAAATREGGMGTSSPAAPWGPTACAKGCDRLPSSFPPLRSA